jgi:glycosyltransferase involved in cell wall biosynthesis
MTKRLLKVLYITARADIGGGPKHVSDLISHIENVDVFMASPREGEFAQVFIDKSIDHLSIPFRKFSVHRFIDMLTFCLNHKIDYIHSHGRGAGVYSRLANIFGQKVIHTFHGVHSPKSFKERLILLLEWFFQFLTWKFISVSPAESENACRLNIATKDRITVIPNGVDLDSFKNIPGPENKKILGTLSRLDSHKNNIELIDFMRELPEYTLMIAGDGEQKSYLESYVLKNNLQERVIFLGVVSNITDFLSSINIYVSASLGEGLPYALLEAMAAKKKIVASRVSGHIDLLGDEDIYELGNINSFKEKLNNPKREYSMDRYDLFTMAELTSAYYNAT